MSTLRLNTPPHAVSQSSADVGHPLFVRNAQTGRVHLDILLLDQFDLGDLAGFSDVLRLANGSVRPPFFRITRFGLSGGPVSSSSHVPVAIEAGTDSLTRSDNLILLGGGNLGGAEATAAYAVLRRLLNSGARIGAIGMAAKLLMGAGLMRDRCVATRLGVSHAWRELFPEIVLTDRIYQFDGAIFTCCGGSATIDLALRGVRDYLGDIVMVQIAEKLNLPRIRSGTDAQLPAPMMEARKQNGKLRQAIELFRRPGEINRTSREVAAELNLSQRQVQRLFHRHLNARPNEYALRCRLEKARQLIAHSELTITEVAMAAGFVSTSHFARRYRLHYGKSPSADRQCLQPE